MQKNAVFTEQLNILIGNHIIFVTYSMIGQYCTTVLFYNNFINPPITILATYFTKHKHITISNSKTIFSQTADQLVSLN